MQALPVCASPLVTVMALAICLTGFDAFVSQGIITVSVSHQAVDVYKLMKVMELN